MSLAAHVRSVAQGWTVFEKAWLAGSTVVIIVCSVIWKSNWVGVVASLTGIWCVILVAKARISNFFFGIINVIAYAHVAYGWQYYGEVMLNIGYFLPMQFVGVAMWLRSREPGSGNVDTVRIRFLGNGSRFVWAVVSVAGIAAYAEILANLHTIAPQMAATLNRWVGTSIPSDFLFHRPNRMPLIDAMSTVLSVVAMVLMNWRYMEQWILWIVIDVVTIVMWFVVVFREGGNDIGVLLMWTAFLVNAVYGLTNWIRMHQSQRGREGGATVG